MSKYQIETINIKTIASLNKKVAETTLKEIGTDKTVEKVQIWEDFPNFDGLTIGSLVEGDVVEKTNAKGYKNVNLYAPKAPYKAGEGKGAQMTKVMEKKAESISHSMDRKEAGIETSSTFRDATALTVAYVQNSEKKYTPEQIKGLWIKNRAWLIEAYGDYEYGQPKLTSKGFKGEDEIDPEDIPF